MKLGELISVDYEVSQNLMNKLGDYLCSLKEATLLTESEIISCRASSKFINFNKFSLKNDGRSFDSVNRNKVEFNKSDSEDRIEILFEAPKLARFDDYSALEEVVDSLRVILVSMDENVVIDKSILKHNNDFLNSIYEEMEKEKIPKSQNLDNFFKILLLFIDDISKKRKYHDEVLRSTKKMIELTMSTRDLSYCLLIAENIEYLVSDSISLLLFNMDLYE